ncbi:MAG: mercury methylation ferredoxin HgcB [Bacteroidota bacterium]|nr:mercury methylation ferredoxin HgcB [Bacteroidota bacterium]MDP4205239.1 mercury methylation ferredoxin HgcB [Bacteroidota bacterium]
MRAFVYLKDVVTLRMDEEKCNGCGMCMKVCPHEVFELSGGKSHIVDRDSCMECGACALNCPKQAIFVKSGVGCAAGILNGIIRNTEPTCDCSKNGGGCC